MWRLKKNSVRVYRSGSERLHPDASRIRSRNAVHCTTVLGEVSIALLMFTLFSQFAKDICRIYEYKARAVTGVR